MLKHNTYFEGKVQSVGFERNGRRYTAGVMDAGEFAFETAGPERMNVVSGELLIKQAGDDAFRHYPAGTAFEVPGKSRFEIRVAGPSAYICEYL